MRPSSVLAFVLRAIGAFVALLLGWYLLGEWFTVPAGVVAKGAVAALFPSWAEGVQQSGTTLALLTTLEVRGVAGAAPGQVALLSPEANFLPYGYGLPLLVALLLAARAGRLPARIALGAAALLPFQVLGVCLDWLKQLAIGMGAAPFSAAERELIAFGYQMGSLVLPALVPVLLWAWLDLAFLRAFVVEAALEGSTGADTARRR